jgi:hypothetical protein
MSVPAGEGWGWALGQAWPQLRRPYVLRDSMSYQVAAACTYLPDDISPAVLLGLLLAPAGRAGRCWRWRWPS